MVILLFSAITNGALLPSKSLTLQENHLVRCLTYISHRHFAPGRTVVISSPSSYRDVQQELIAEIQQTKIWPVVTLNGNFSENDEKVFIDRDGSYIILTQNENIWNLLNEFHSLKKNRETKYRISWNFEARFVVAGANEFSMEQMQLISIFFRSVRMYNFVIVSQEHYEINNELSSTINFNDVDTGMKLGTYTWFPYQSSDSCTSVHDITLLDIWVISEQGHFTKNTDLFPVKIRKSFNGCFMSSYVIEDHWELTTNYVHDNSNGNGGSYIKSLEYQLLQIVLQKMNMTFFHVQTPTGFEARYENITNYISGRMRLGFIDIAVGDVGSHYLFKSGLNSTNSYSIMSIRWYVPCSVAYPRWSSIFRILSVELWLVLIISIVIASISTKILGQYSCKSEWQGYKTLTSSLTSFWAVILGVSVSTMPRTPSLRLLFFAWVCFSLAFNTVFQAFLTTFLINSGYKTPIRNMDELFDSGIKLAYPPEYSFILKNDDEKLAENVQRIHVNCLSYEVCVIWAKYHKNISILMPHIIAEGN